MRRVLLSSALILLCAIPCQPGLRPAVGPLQRTILAIYNSAQYRDVRDTRLHRLLEMPLNHLGMVVRYRDLQKGLPKPEEMQDVRGVVTWFRGDAMPHPAEFLKWGAQVIDSGKRFVVIGDMSVSKDNQGSATPVPLVNAFLGKLGLQIMDWTSVTYDQRIAYQDPAVIGFERPLPVVLPSFDRMRIVDPAVRSHLTLRKNGDPSSDAPLVVTGPHGGWVEVGYTHFANISQDQIQWYINPFEFLRLAFATDEVPKLDTTTLSGRRIYYSQIDGDGWRNLTEVPKYRRDKLSAAEVVLKEAIQPFPDLPVTVAPIAGDLDEIWFGTRESRGVAREILSLPWVEAGSHTYSHPLDWETLYQRPVESSPQEDRSAVPALLSFLPASWIAVNRAAERYAQPLADEATGKLKRGHATLRSYTLLPFEPDREIAGSIAFINGLLPPGKHVAIMQWSGTTLVPESVLQATLKAGLRNINGGDTRFDPEFHSYAWVAPLSRQVGGLRQVYSSNSNENTYTNSWNERYFGFRYLRQTLERTDAPVRVKPLDVYYHMYSGEKQPGIDAVVENLRYARSQELAPITASQYAAIVDGFHSAQIFEIGPRTWRIENRDGLDTVRFDHADELSVAWASSRGVIGQRRYQGSLYIALDATERSPIVALAGVKRSSASAYMAQSRWRVSRFSTVPDGVAFLAQGFGNGEMEFAASPDATFEVCVSRASHVLAKQLAHSSHDGKLQFVVLQNAIDPLEIRVQRVGASR